MPWSYKGFFLSSVPREEIADIQLQKSNGTYNLPIAFCSFAGEC
jgi:hypothetical protein